MDRSSPATSEKTGLKTGERSSATAPARRLPLSTQAAPDPRADGAPAWRTLLAGTPREVLARLVQGDPLGVRGVVAERLRSGSVLLDADRVQLRVIARIARSAGRYRGRPVVDDWVDGHVLQIIAEVIREDHESARGCVPTGEGLADVFTALAGPLGLEPASMRKACAAFNVLPLADRAAFVDLVLRNRSLDELARELGQSATQIARCARRALDAILESARPLGERKGSE